VGRTDTEFNLNSEVIDPINLTASATWVVAGQSYDHPCSGGRCPGIFSDGPIECHCLYQMGTGSPKWRQPFLLDQAVTPAPRYAVTLRCGKIS